MNRKTRLLLSLWALCFTCPALAQEQSKNWFNVAYLQCLDERLPCECQEKHYPAYLRFDTLNHLAMWGEVGTYDASTYKLLKKDGQHLAYFPDYDTPLFDTIVVMGRFELSDDTLYWSHRKWATETYVRAGKPGDKFSAEEQYHTTLFNKALAKRGYASLEQLLNREDILCGCHFELGNKNFIRSRRQFWFLEQRRNKIFLYEWTNDPEEKNEDLVVKKKLVKKFNWK